MCQRKQAWGELHCNVMHYITITLKKPCFKLQLHACIKVNLQQYGKDIVSFAM